MLTAIEYIRTKHRMCSYHGLCVACPIKDSKCDSGLLCNEWCSNNPAKAIELVEQWGKDHPVKTILMDFLEKYPDAELQRDGFPIVCPHNLGYPSRKPHCLEDEVECELCWNTPLEEVNK